MTEFASHFAAYVPYLEDVRNRIYRVTITFIGFFIVGFLAAAPLLQFILRTFHIPSVTLVATSPFQFIDLAMSIGIFIAAICCAPLVLYHVYDFLRDSMERKEKRFLFLVVPISIGLFATGFMYGFGTLYYALGAVAKLNITLGIANLWEINRFFTQIVSTSILLGLIFEFPIVLTFLIRQQLVTHAWFKTKRRHAYACVFVFVSLLPPTDGLSLMIMALPLLAIFELTLLINRPWVGTQIRPLKH